MTGGTYGLVCVLDGAAPATITFGAAGERALDHGAYTYVGSALGPGGFARLDRHREIASGERAVRHWHVDYLLGHERVSIVDTIRLPGVDRECELAKQLPGTAIPGIGASDCGCESHLFAIDHPVRVRASIPEHWRE